jgi:hypothetical protein
LPGFAATEPPMTVSSTLDLSSLESLLHAAAMDFPPVLLALFRLHISVDLGVGRGKKRESLDAKMNKPLRLGMWDSRSQYISLTLPPRNYLQNPHVIKTGVCRLSLVF